LKLEDGKGERVRRQEAGKLGSWEVGRLAKKPAFFL